MRWPHDGTRVGVAVGSPTGLPCPNEACEEGHVLSWSDYGASLEACPDCKGRGRTPTFHHADETRLRMDAYTEAS